MSHPSKRISQQELESYLWGAAVLLRGLIDAGDYKQFIFPLLFYKRVSDVWDEEYHAALATGVLKNFRAGNVRWHEVGCEFNPLKVQMENLRDGFHEQRLGESGRAGDEAMPTGEQRNEQLLNDILLADDNLGQLGLDARAAGFDLLDSLFFGDMA